MIKNKKRKKTFKNNPDYFEWYNENKEQIKIVDFKIMRDKIKLSYEERVEENDKGRIN